MVVCEGLLTEPDYLKDFANDHGFKDPLFELTLIQAGAPVTVVERAIEEKDKLNAELRRLPPAKRFVSKVWAVCDVDVHPNLNQARSRARDNEIPLALSNPCLELWALYHFQDQNGFIHRHEAAKALPQYMPKYHPQKNKRFDYAQMRGLYDTAKQRAVKGRNNREKEGDPDSNPSTNVYELLEWIKGQAAPLTTATPP